MNSILKVSNLTKSYGKVKAVKNLSLTVEKGSVFGILGPNGSGKTTTLGILLGALHCSSGSFEWFGKPLSHESKLKIGALLEQPNFYPYLSALNNLKIVADIKNISYDAIDRVLKLVNLFERRNDVVHKYSFGMKQRLAIASAMLSEPQVLVLDEPTNGLDPQGIVSVREVIRRVAEQGTTIILASHLLDEVEKVCSHVAVIKSGELLVCGSVNDVLASQSIVEVAADNSDALFQTLSTLTYLKDIRKNVNGKISYSASVTDSISGAKINSDLFVKGITLSHLAVKHKSLESYFLEITKNN